MANTAGQDVLFLGVVDRPRLELESSLPLSTSSSHIHHAVSTPFETSTTKIFQAGPEMQLPCDPLSSDMHATASKIMMAANRTGTSTNRVNRNRVNRFCEPRTA